MSSMASMLLIALIIVQCMIVAALAVFCNFSSNIQLAFIMVGVINLLIFTTMLALQLFNQTTKELNTFKIMSLMAIIPAFVALFCTTLFLSLPVLTWIL